jgi:uncharacterized protein (DUF1697 family)
MALNLDTDKIHVEARELYWLSHRREREFLITSALIGKTLGAETTMRNSTTVCKIAEKYC